MVVSIFSFQFSTFDCMVEVSILGYLTGVKKPKPSHTVKSRDMSREMPWSIWTDTQTSEQGAGIKASQAPHSTALNFSSHLNHSDPLKCAHMQPRHSLLRTQNGLLVKTIL